MAPLIISPVPQLGYKFKMDGWWIDINLNKGWLAGQRLLFTTCYVIIAVQLSNSKSASRHVFSRNSINKCMQLKKFDINVGLTN